MAQRGRNSFRRAAAAAVGDRTCPIRTTAERSTPLSVCTVLLPRFETRRTTVPVLRPPSPRGDAGRGGAAAGRPSAARHAPHGPPPPSAHPRHRVRSVACLANVGKIGRPFFFREPAGRLAAAELSGEPSPIIPLSKVGLLHQCVHDNFRMNCAAERSGSGARCPLQAVVEQSADNGGQDVIAMLPVLHCPEMACKFCR